jgi:hypothetical protein
MPLAMADTAQNAQVARLLTTHAAIGQMVNVKRTRPSTVLTPVLRALDRAFASKPPAVRLEVVPVRPLAAFALATSPFPLDLREDTKDNKDQPDKKERPVRHRHTLGIAATTLNSPSGSFTQTKVQTVAAPRLKSTSPETDPS